MKKLYISIFSVFLALNILSCTPIVNTIQKVDNRINPKLKFDVSKASGVWYLLYDNDMLSRNFENISIELAQEGQGYNYITKGYNTKKNKWVKVEGRAWVQEDKDNVYFYVRKSGPLNNKNKIIYFDDKMEYLAIYFEDNRVIKIMTRSTSVDTDTVNEILAEIKRAGYNTSRLKKPNFDPSIRDDEELEKAQKEKDFYERLSKFGEDGTIKFDEAVEVKK
ncbi:MAG: lipocalin family protein [Sebaldella sp.]|nr:lipocalin family protein [Sebaldella sp.]